LSSIFARHSKNIWANALSTVQCWSANQADSRLVSLQKHHIGEHLLFLQVCSDPPPVHCSTAQGKYIPHCSSMLCKITG